MKDSYGLTLRSVLQLVTSATYFGEHAALPPEATFTYSSLGKHISPVFVSKFSHSVKILF